MSYLVLVRHGESVWNEKGIWTGLTDIELNDKGREEAVGAAARIRNISFDFAFTSPLKRSTETYELIQDELNIHPAVRESSFLNERDYGEYTGKNKWEIQKQVGEDAFLKIRRGWNTPIPGGETLKQVYERVIPYYQKEIEPLLKNGKNVLIVAHGNSLRALVKYLENISDSDVEHIELKTGEVWIYEIGSDGAVLGKKVI